MTVTSRLLLCSDQPEILAELAAMLEPLGHSLLYANTSVEATAAVAQHAEEMAVVVIDAQSSLQIAATVRAHAAEMAILFLSQRSAFDELAESFAGTPFDVLGKPIHAALLRAKVSLFVGLKQRLSAITLAEAQASNAHLRSVFMQAPVPICILRGAEHRFELTNPSYRRLVGNRDLIGSSVREALPELDGQGFYELLERVFSSGEPYIGAAVPTRLKNEHDELEERVLDFVYEPFREADGAVSGVLVVAHDVTERVRTRAASERAFAASAKLNEELAEARNQLRDLVDNLPELAWSARPDGYIDFYNQRWYEYTGTTLEDMQGSGWEKLHDPEFLPEVNARWKRSLESGVPFEMEFPLRGADGTFRWFLTRIRPVRDRSGKIVRWFGTNANIHEQRQANRKAEAASLAKDEFLATASHELRTPLNAILGWAHLLRSGKLDSSAYLRGVETIERNARAQVQLIEDILDGSRIITGKLRLEVRPLDLTELVQAALEAIRPAANAKQIELSVALDPSAARVVGDPERLQQVVWNLVNNAVKFTLKGGSVYVRLERLDTHVELTVADTGQGISADFLPHVFDRFRQAEGSSTRRHGGLGLGLALVWYLVEAHGGTVSAESEGVGRGARFVVQLPVQSAYQEQSNPERATPTPLVPTSARPEGLAGVSVLVVDDEADARDLVATVLRGAGAEVTTAANAQEAIDLLTTTQPLILLSDIGMPETDGYELIRRVRTLSGSVGAHIPAVALTAYAREQDRRLALEAGFQTHVAKPVDPTELLRVVSSLLHFIRRKSSAPEREVALERADTFLKFERILETQGVHDALHFLNSRTPHRFTGVYRFEPPTLRNLLLVDSYTPTVKQGADSPMAQSYCSIVSETGQGFTTEDTRLDDRLRTHPARESMISYSGVLLRDELGEPFGTLCHFDLVPCEVPVREMPLLEAAAPLIVSVIRGGR